MPGKLILYSGQGRIAHEKKMSGLFQMKRVVNFSFFH